MLENFFIIQSNNIVRGKRKTCRLGMKFTLMTLLKYPSFYGRSFRHIGSIIHFIEVP